MPKGETVKSETKKSIMQDISLIGGALLVSFGAYSIYEPAGLIVAGSMVIFAAFPRGKAQ